MKSYVKEPVVPGDGDERHGRYATYSNHGCRCELCTDAFRLKQREYRERLRVLKTPDHVHGSTNGYLNYACRCEPCTEAHTANSLEQRRRTSAELKQLRAENTELKRRIHALESQLLAAQAAQYTAQAQASHR